MTITTVFNFEVAPRRKAQKVITGSFVQFSNNNVQILTDDGDDISKKIDSVINNPLNFIAKMILTKHPDLYKSVTNTDDNSSVKVKTLAQAEKDIPIIKTTSLFKFPNGTVFSEDALSQVIYDVNEKGCALSDIIGQHTIVNVPTDGVYSRSSFINDVFFANHVDIGVNRQIIKNLQAGTPIIKKFFDENDVATVQVVVCASTSTSKSNCKILTEKTRVYSSQMTLTINRIWLNNG